MQPVATLTVNGSPSATVRVGEPVTVRIEAEAPGEGVVVEVREVVTGADGSEVLGDLFELAPAKTVAVERDAVFAEPGTHFVAVRVAAQVDGNPADPHARAQNVARARVSVVP